MSLPDYPPDWPDVDGVYRFLTAFTRLWLRDARKEPEELAEVARWLEMEPAEVLERMALADQVLAAPVRESAFYRACPACGRALTEYNASTRGRQRLYCDDQCRRRAEKKRRKERTNDVAI